MQCQCGLSAFCLSGLSATSLSAFAAASAPLPTPSCYCSQLPLGLLLEGQHKLCGSTWSSQVTYRLEASGLLPISYIQQVLDLLVCEMVSFISTFKLLTTLNRPHCHLRDGRGHNEHSTPTHSTVNFNVPTLGKDGHTTSFLDPKACLALWFRKDLVSPLLA